MKYSVMKKWVKALRSGKYKQTREVLKNEDGYCCLGVLCEVVGMKPTKAKTGGFKFGRELGVLPKTARKLSGVKTGTGDFDIAELADLNDKGSDFSQLANLIEQNWKKL